MTASANKDKRLDEICQDRYQIHCKLLETKD